MVPGTRAFTDTELTRKLCGTRSGNCTPAMGTSPRAERERVLEAFGRHRMHAHSPAAMIAVGDLVRVPGSDTSFVQEGEVGTAIAVSDE